MHASRDVQATAHGTGRLPPCVSHANHDSLRSAQSIWHHAGHHACSPRPAQRFKRQPHRSHPIRRALPSLHLSQSPHTCCPLTTWRQACHGRFICLCVTTDGKHQGDLAVSSGDPSRYRRVSSRPCCPGLPWSSGDTKGTQHNCAPRAKQEAPWASSDAHGTTMCKSAFAVLPGPVTPRSRGLRCLGVCTGGK
jgi:hypothetical protein